MNTWTEKGQGRKNCPSCNIYVPVRTSTCQCGHVFVAKAAKEPKPAKAPKAPKETDATPEEEVVRKTKFVTTVKGADEVKTSTEKTFRSKHELLTPAGPCPVDLPGISQDAIAEWVTACRKTEPLYYLGYTCFAYWLATVYDRTTPTFKLASEVLQRHFAGEALRHMGDVKAKTYGPTASATTEEEIPETTETPETPTLE